MKTVIGFLFLLVIPTSVLGYNILGICSAGIKSHWSSCESVFRALSAANHNVTIISMLESNFGPLPNHHLLHLDGLIPTYLSYYPENFSDMQSGSETISVIVNVGIRSFELMMRHPKMQRFLSEDHKFDLVIVESFATEGFYGFGEHFNAPLIGLSTTVATGWLNLAVGNFEPWSSVPNQFLHAHPEMTFNDRFENVILNLYEYLTVQLHLIPESDRMMREHFPRNQKPLHQVMENDVCLGFVNDHFTLSLARAKSPNMIEIGGIHLNPTTTDDDRLPGEFQEFMQDSSEGVIVFSLGSILRASELKESDRQAFIKVFSRLKEKVIWRYDLSDAKELPKNILARSWIPQGQLLAHPNVKLFISHGGMLGTTEAVYNGVPVLGIPFFGDQHVNIARAEHRGYARRINRHAITEKGFEEQLRQILDDPKYQSNAKRFSEAFKDKPMTPQESVVFWSEYVIKHKCADFMKVQHARQGIIENHNMDVWACLGLVLVTVASFVVLLLQVIFSALAHFKQKLKND